MNDFYLDEEWRSIPGYPNYEISNFGRVFNSRHRRFLKIRINNDGYEEVGLYHNGVERKVKVHRLVAMSFIPRRDPSAKDVNHDDGDKRYNHAHNLDWVTKRENQLHAYRTGLKKPSPKAGRKRTPVRVIQTGEVYQDQHACAQAIGGLQSSISQCLSGKLKTHHGFSFEYVIDERGDVWRL